MNLVEKYRALMAPDGPASGGGDAPSSTPSAAPSGAASPAPSPSSAGSPPPSGTDSGAGEGFDFGAMFDAPSDSVAALAATEAPPAKGTEPVQPPPHPTESPAAAPAEAPPKDAKVEPAAAPDAAKVASDQSTPPVAPMAPQFDQYDPISLSNHLAQNEAAARQFVAEQMFQLTPAEKEALEQDVIGTIPQLLAKVFVRSQHNVLQQMGRMIPVMMQRHLDAVKRNSSGEDKFYKRWPGLDPDKHGDTARKYAAVYRQMHPQATLDQMIEDLGPMIMMAHKVAPTLPTAAPGRAAGPAPQGGANGRSPPPSPFVPAGAGPVSASRAPELEPWEAMFQPRD